MKGICNLAVIPLRREPASTSEMVSQLLFGDTFIIHNTVDGWTEITTDYDQYHGFVSEKQYALFNHTNEDWVVNTAFPYAEVISDDGLLMLPAGCSFPAHDRFMIGTTGYTLKQNPVKRSPSDWKSTALQYLNAPYLWGGKTAFGIDCSGFTQIVFKQCGITLPRDAYQQAEIGDTVAFVGETRPGDLAFFDNEAGRITHVGLMLENQQIIHASGKVRIDELDHYGIMNADEKKYSHKLRIIKRVF